MIFENFLSSVFERIISLATRRWTQRDARSDHESRSLNFPGNPRLAAIESLLSLLLLSSFQTRPIAVLARKHVRATRVFPFDLINNKVKRAQCRPVVYVNNFRPLRDLLSRCETTRKIALELQTYRPTSLSGAFLPREGASSSSFSFSSSLGKVIDLSARFVLDTSCRDMSKHLQMRVARPNIAKRFIQSALFFFLCLFLLTWYFLPLAFPCDY